MAIMLHHIAIENAHAVVVDTAYKVADVVAIYDEGRSPIEWIVENYNLNRAQIHAALAYYYDHQQEIDDYLQRIVAEIEAKATPLRDKIMELKQRQNK